MGRAFLDDRGIVEVEGPDARALLHRLVTSDVSRLAPGECRYAALLSPQGKIAADFLIVEASPPGGPERFLIDVASAEAQALAKKLILYRLRADVRIADRGAELGVTAHWPGGGGPDDGSPDVGGSGRPGVRDPRHPGLGTRAIGPRGEGDPGDRLAYDAHRIALGVPDGGRDYIFGDAFPHDANLDRLGGVDFDKGCYVGQEVVSRVHHRGTARKRVVPVGFGGAAPAVGTEIVAGGIALGTMGTSVSAEGRGRGLATIRLDRAAEAAASGTPATAGGVVLALSLS